MTPFDFEVAFVGVRIDSTGVVNVCVHYGDVCESLCRDVVQLPADLKPEGGVSSGGIVKYVRPIDFDNFHHLRETAEVSE